MFNMYMSVLTKEACPDKASPAHPGNEDLMNEPDVTLTDYALALECGVFAYWLFQEGGDLDSICFWYGVFFFTIAVAAFVGGTVHGYVPDESSSVHRGLWCVTLIAVGATAWCGWIIGARAYFGDVFVTIIYWGASLVFAVYVAAVLFGARDYSLAILHYLPSAGFLFVTYCLVYRANGDYKALVGAGGLFLTLIAAVIQYRRWGLHPVYFSPNALYHAVQAVGLFLIYWSVRCFTIPK